MVLENDTGNLLEALNLSEDQYGIEKLLCLNQSDGENYAIRFNNPSDTTLATSNLFPNGFPVDFSILIVVRQLTTGKQQTKIALPVCDGRCASKPRPLVQLLSWVKSRPAHSRSHHSHLLIFL